LPRNDEQQAHWLWSELLPRSDEDPEETELLALKKALTLRLRQAMKRAGLSQSQLAKKMRTSRTVIDRMLDPSDTGVTLAILTRAFLGFE